MADRYLPQRSSRDEQPRYARDRDYDPYARYDRHERADRSSRYADDGYDRYGGNERYRSPPRNGRDRYGDDIGYTFRGAAGGDAYRPPHDQFSYRAPGPRFPSPHRHAPPSGPRAQPPSRRNDYPRGGARGRGARGQYNGRGRYRPPPPSSRDILHKTGRANTPEQLEGMNVDGQVRFNALVSSSDEYEADDAKGPTSSSEEEGEIRRKRFKVDAPPPRPEVPKWSNPDPYSALPPVETTSGPKKDIVQVIRKAKNEVARKSDKTFAAKNADFISFNFDEDMDDDDASTGDVDATNDASSEASSVRSFTMSRNTRSNGTYEAHGSAGPSYAPNVPAGGKNGLSKHPAPIDLTQSDGEDDDEDEMPPHRPRGREIPAIDLTAEDEGLPQPPHGFVMPTDEELVQQYIGQPKGKKRKHNEQAKGRGDITDAWAPNWTEPTPWCNADHSHSEDVGLRLHQEITDFFDFVRPHQHEEAIRQDLVQRVQTAVRSFGPSARDVDIKCFGSFAAGLYLPTADMDLVAVSANYTRTSRPSFCQTKSQMWKLVDHLIRSGIAQPGSTTAIASAKVPIIKFTEKETGIKVDISFENDSGLKANRTFQEWKLEFPTMPVVVVLIKQLLAMRDLNEVFTGGLGGFSIICLVVSMLQLMPDDEWDEVSESSQPYTDLLLKFLDLYGNEFSTRETGIMMNPPRFYDKIKNPVRAQNDQNLTIIDPNNPNNDISGGSREVHAVFEVFRKARSQILQRMSRMQARKELHNSILGCVLGGNYTSFIHQRNRLYRLYTGGSVSPPPEPARNGQSQPSKRKRGKPGNTNQPTKRSSPNDNTQGHPAASAPGGPLSARVQGGPPAKQRYVTRQAAAFKDVDRANSLRREHPGLASVIPQQLSKVDFMKLKNQYNLS